uniref:MYND-type domain-containing protein n=1 Tax=Glossina brevipalpis TaxID=37001 RepID=A0A1A9WSR9_9MUSC
MGDFVHPEELTHFIESIRPFQIAEIGTPKWLDVHEMILKLSQQAFLEAIEHREEEVKEMLITNDKLKVLIHEVFGVFLWKTRVLPHLLNIDPNPEATFMIYTVLYHEGAVMSLLDVALYHESACQVLQDSAIDLVDYCAQAVAQVIGLVSMGYHENETNLDVDASILSELERQKRDLMYKIGLRSISILNYMSVNVNALPLSASRRMVVTHDVPWLMADLLHFRPWQRKTKKGLEKYIDDKWIIVEGDEATKVVKHEAQAWVCMRQILFNSNLMQNYEISEERRKRLAGCQSLLHECLLDQLPPLVDLKQFLINLSVSTTSSSKSTSTKSNLLLEEVPEIRERLIAETEKFGGFVEIAKRQEDIFLCKDKEKISNIAKRLNAAYNTDLLAELEQKILETRKESASTSGGVTKTDEVDKYICGNCLVKAKKKCSHCKSIYYCSRKCQLNDWPKHKKNCVKV